MKKLIGSLFLFSAAAMATAAHAADYPQRAIRIIVPFAAGGITDVMGARSPTISAPSSGSPSSWRTGPGPAA